MKITYSIWQGSLHKGSGFTAKTMKEVVKAIAELNEVEPKPKFEYFVTKIEQESN
jgi:hypothetical protein